MSEAVRIRLLPIDLAYEREQVLPFYFFYGGKSFRIDSATGCDTLPCTPGCPCEWQSPYERGLRLKERQVLPCF